MMRRHVSRRRRFANSGATLCVLGSAMLSGCAAGTGSRGAPWTIQCVEAGGPQRVEQLERLSETLKRTRGVRAADVYVVDHSDGMARLYYGTYLRRTDARTGKRHIPAKMREDLTFLRELGDGAGHRYFLQAIPVREPTPDVGHPAWALSKVPATYSLQVAAFEPTGDFTAHKQAAAEFCQLLRAKGYEAYYHHGRACSIVTVGAFGPEAVITSPNGHVFYSREVLALQQTELLKYNHVNGAVIRVIGEEGRKVPVPSRLVEIVHRTDAG